jgi:hypothetical protein
VRGVNVNHLLDVLSNDNILSIGWERSQAERTINLINPEIPDGQL